MTKQLNIRSDEAYEIAHQFARDRGTTVTAVVETALRDFRDRQASDDLTPDQRAFVDEIMALAERSSAAARPGATSDHSDFYDEKGLPI